MTGGVLNAAMPIGIDFARKLKSLGLTRFERLVEAHHTRVVTIDDFRRSLEMAGYNGF